MGCAVQARDPFDGDGRSSRALHLGPHGVQAEPQVLDLRLAGGVLQHRFAPGQDRRQHQVLGGSDRNEGKLDPRAPEPPRGLGEDIALVQVDGRAERFQPLQMQVHRPGADRAAPGQRDLGVTGAGDQGSQHVERGAHLAHQFVGRDGAEDLRGMQHRLRTVGPVITLDDLTAQAAQQIGQGAGVGQAGHVGEPQRLVAEQARRHQLEGGVLGARDRDHALKSLPPGDDDSVHPAPMTSAARASLM